MLVECDWPSLVSVSEEEIVEAMVTLGLFEAVLQFLRGNRFDRVRSATETAFRESISKLPAVRLHPYRQRSRCMTSLAN